MSTPLEASRYFQKLADALARTQVTQSESGKAPASLDDGAERAVSFIVNAKTNGNKILLVGNGGSAAIVSHMQNDLCDSVGARAMVFNEPPFLTAISNDHGYETFFEQAVHLWAESNDVLVAISSSGRSKSILRAVEAARRKNAHIITLSGFAPDNLLRQAGDVNFYVAAEEYGMVETAHAAITHYLTDSSIYALKGVALGRS